MTNQNYILELVFSRTKSISNLVVCRTHSAISVLTNVRGSTIFRLASVVRIWSSPYLIWIHSVQIGELKTVEGTNLDYQFGS